MRKEQGYIVITSTLVVFAIGMMTALFLLQVASNEVHNTRTVEQSNLAKAFANACAELAIQRMITSPTFTGTSTQQMSGGSCDYTLTRPTSSTAVIDASGTVSTIKRKVQVNMNTSLSSITKWQEVP